MFLSHKSGLGVQLEKEFGRTIPIKHHCLSHRTDLMTESAMEEFCMFENFEINLKTTYSFYKASHKRQNSLNEFMKEISEPLFRLAAVFDVRWMSSFKIAVDKLKNNYANLVKHLDFLLENIREFGGKNPEAFESKVEGIKDFMTNKYAICLMHFNYDPIELFTKESEYTQKKGSTLIGMAKRKRTLINNLEDVKQQKGVAFKKFLSESSCFRTKAQVNSFLKKPELASPCITLQKYEESKYIVYKGIILMDTELKDSNDVVQFTKVSEIIVPYIEELVKQINIYLPKDEVLKFDPLDQTTWTGYKNTRWKVPKITEIANVFGMDADLVQPQFNRLVNAMMRNPGYKWWCKNKASDPEHFWAAVLRRRNPGPDVAKLIRKVLAVPMGETFLS